MSDGFEPPFEEQPPHSPFPSPDDRLWRHPSEMARIGPPSAAAPVVAPPRPLRLGGIVLTGLGLGLFLAGSFVAAGFLHTPQAPIRQTATEALFISSSTTTGLGGWLGVSVVDTAQGIEVLACDRGSPAEIALRPGDVILGLGGYLTRTTAELVDVLRLTPPRSVAPVLVVRNHVIIQLQVQVAPHP